MCIINEEADVSDTNIFVCPNKFNTIQLTVYSNEVYTERNNMMIT